MLMIVYLIFLKKEISGTSSSLQNIRKDYLNKRIFANLNINSIQNKFDSLADIIKEHINEIRNQKRQFFSEWPVFLKWFWNTIASKSKWKWWRYYVFH